MKKTFAAAVDVLSRLPHIAWRQTNASAQGYGGHNRRQAGLGEHFWQFRPYVIGDSGRDVDWKQTARRDALSVREHQKQSVARFQLWLDASASMDFSSNGRLFSKRDYAETLLFALSMFFLEAGEKVSWATKDNSFAGGADGINRLLPRLKSMAADMPAWPDAAVPLAISDFYFPAETFAERMKTRPGGLAVQIYDAAEADWPFEGRLSFSDPENSGAEERVFDDAAQLRQEMQSRFLSHREKLSEAAKSAGWAFLSFSTAEPLTETTLRIIERLSHE